MAGAWRSVTVTTDEYMMSPGLLSRAGHMLNTRPCKSSFGFVNASPPFMLLLRGPDLDRCLGIQKQDGEQHLRSFAAL